VLEPHVFNICEVKFILDLANQPEVIASLLVCVLM
jgi:hypothetical protein